MAFHLHRLHHRQQHQHQHLPSRRQYRCRCFRGRNRILLRRLSLSLPGSPRRRILHLRRQIHDQLEQRQHRRRWSPHRSVGRLRGAQQTVGKYVSGNSVLKETSEETYIIGHFILESNVLGLEERFQRLLLLAVDWLVGNSLDDKISRHTD